MSYVKSFCSGEKLCHASSEWSDKWDSSEKNCIIPPYRQSKLLFGEENHWISDIEYKGKSWSVFLTGFYWKKWSISVMYDVNIQWSSHDRWPRLLTLTALRTCTRSFIFHCSIKTMDKNLFVPAIWTESCRHDHGHFIIFVYSPRLKMAGTRRCEA